MERQKWLTLSNPDPGVHVATICVTDSEGHRGTLAHQSTKAVTRKIICAVRLWAELAAQKDKWQRDTMIQIPVSGRLCPPKWTKWACHLRNTTNSVYCQSHHVSCKWRLPWAFQFLQTFWMNLAVILIKFVILCNGIHEHLENLHNST